MRFNVKMTATAALVLGAAFVWTPPSAYALDQAPKQPASAEQTTAQKDEKTTTPAPVTVTVQQGDSLSKIADANSTTWVRLYDANAGIADPNLINPGEVVTVPTADAQLPDRYGALTAAQRQTMPSVPQAQQTTQATHTYARASTTRSAGGPNAYYWGQCTWYVKTRRPDIGGYWGNAGYNWLSEARAAGFSTGSTPAAGAVAVEPGHVAYVESVSGSNVTISEMNYSGVGVYHTRTVPASKFQYIY